MAELNNNGGYYERGKQYSLAKKVAVAQELVRLSREKAPVQPTITELAAAAKVSWKYADQVYTEILTYGWVVHPDDIRRNKRIARGVGLKLQRDEELFLLALRSQNPQRPNLDYIRQLYDYSGTKVSSTFISQWFQNRFDHSGAFRKPNLVPIDKFRQANILRYAEYRVLMETLNNHHKWNFLDEKHLINKDTLPIRVHADPLTGRLDTSSVSGDFQKF